MIQRIQTIFLLVVAAAFFSLFGLDFASSSTAADGYLADKAFDIQDHTALLVVTALGGILAILNIFLFKNRILQLRFGYLLILLSLLLPILGVVLLYLQYNAIPSGIQAGLGLIAPLGAFIFAVLANRFIKKDEKLVKSMNRLR